MKIKTMSSVALLSVAMLASTVSIAAEKLRIATEGAWAPFNYVESSGEVKGFDVDIAHALCERMKVECDIVLQDWDGMIPALMVRKYDAIVSSMSITKDRLKQVDFTDPYYSGGLRFIGPAGKAMGTSKAELNGKTIGAQRSTIAGMYLEDNMSGSVNIKLYDNQDSVYLDLKSGRLDGALSDELPTYNWLKSENGQGFEFKGQAFAKDDKIGIAIRKGSPLKSRINKALAEIIKDGTYAEINARYFPFSIY